MFWSVMHQWVPFLNGSMLLLWILIHTNASDKYIFWFLWHLRWMLHIILGVNQQKSFKLASWSGIVTCQSKSLMALFLDSSNIKGRPAGLSWSQPARLYVSQPVVQSAIKPSPPHRSLTALIHLTVAWRCSFWVPYNLWSQQV